MKNTIHLLCLGTLLALSACKKEERQEPSILSCTISCQNGGTVTSDCACDCPPGYSGTNCQIVLGPTCSLSGGWVLRNSYNGAVYANEQEITLPAGHFFTGIGVRVYNNEVTTIRAHYRKLNSDCTLGTIQSTTVGLAIQPQVEFNVPNGYAVTGVGLGFDGGHADGIVVHYRQLIPQSGGGWRLGSDSYAGYDFYDGTAIIERSVITSGDPSRRVLTAFGALCYSDDVHQIWAEAKQLTP